MQNLILPTPSILQTSVGICCGRWTSLQLDREIWYMARDSAIVHGPNITQYKSADAIPTVCYSKRTIVQTRTYSTHYPESWHTCSQHTCTIPESGGPMWQLVRRSWCLESNAMCARFNVLFHGGCSGWKHGQVIPSVVRCYVHANDRNRNFGCCNAKSIQFNFGDERPLLSPLVMCSYSFTSKRVGGMVHGRLSCLRKGIVKRDCCFPATCNLRTG